MWQQLNITVHAESAEILADRLQSYGAIAVSFVDAQQQPLFQIAPDETPLWDYTQVIALFSQEFNLLKCIATLKKKYPNLMQQYNMTELAEQDWVRQTQKNFPAQCFGNDFWVVPSWESALEDKKSKIVIDPGLAFGTGTHPTTGLCLTWLAQHPPKDLIVVDYGCGSGILALAALALGARKVYAIDHDPQALEATQNNAKLNSCVTSDNLITLPPEAMPAIQADVVLANILSGALISLHETLTQLTAKNGVLVLSGLLRQEMDKVLQVYLCDQYISSAEKEDWMMVALRHGGK